MKTAAMDTPQPGPLSSEIGISLALHLLLAIAVLFHMIVFPQQPIVLEHAIRVDLVDLPDKVSPTEVQEQPANSTPALPSKTQSKASPPKVQLTPKANRKTQNAALERIKALQNIESEVQNEENAKAAKAKPTYKGQVLNPGTQLTGVDQLQHDTYLGDLDAHVKKNWLLPQWLKNANLKARVLVFLDSNGNVLDKKLTQSSRNPMYDEKVLEAIDRANPFPKPPAKFSRILEVNGVEFGFPE